MKKARTKCYIYTRVSTAMQVDGYSLDAQRESCANMPIMKIWSLPENILTKDFPVKHSRTARISTDAARCARL